MLLTTILPNSLGLSFFTFPFFVSSTWFPSLSFSIFLSLFLFLSFSLSHSLSHSLSLSLSFLFYLNLFRLVYLLFSLFCVSSLFLFYHFSVLFLNHLLLASFFLSFFLSFLKFSFRLLLFLFSIFSLSHSFTHSVTFTIFNYLTYICVSSSSSLTPPHLSALKNCKVENYPPWGSTMWNVSIFYTWNMLS